MDPMGQAAAQAPHRAHEASVVGLIFLKPVTGSPDSRRGT